jgi:hypothetical protein
MLDGQIILIFRYDSCLGRMRVLKWSVGEKADSRKTQAWLGRELIQYF